MNINILTLFPNMFSGPFDQSIVKRAIDKGLVNINLVDIRKYASDERGTVDDRPFGGGVGMIMQIEPIFKALSELNVSKNSNKITKIILTDPRGTKFTQKKAEEFSKLENLVIICGHYEGIDERVKEYLIDEAISIGDYVLTGGEIPAMTITDSVTRLIPGVLSKDDATKLETFSNMNSDFDSIVNPYFEHPQYTRPADFNGWKVPEVLLSGNHKEIEEWRKNH